MTYKEDFKQKYQALIDEGWQYILINTKKKRLPTIETIIVRRENFESKLKEMLFMYDDDMKLKILDKYHNNVNEEEPVIKVVGIYGMTTDVFDE